MKTIEDINKIDPKLNEILIAHYKEYKREQDVDIYDLAIAIRQYAYSKGYQDGYRCGREELEEENKKLKADVERYNNSLGMATDKIDELEKEIESLKSENEQLKEDNDTLRKNQMVWVDSSGKAIDGLLGQASDTQLATLLAKRGYHGEISRSERLYDVNMQTSVGEKIETIKL